MRFDVFCRAAWRKATCGIADENIRCVAATRRRMQSQVTRLKATSTCMWPVCHVVHVDESLNNDYIYLLPTFYAVGFRFLSELEVRLVLCWLLCDLNSQPTDCLSRHRESILIKAHAYTAARSVVRVPTATIWAYVINGRLLKFCCFRDKSNASGFGFIGCGCLISKEFTQSIKR